MAIKSKASGSAPLDIVKVCARQVSGPGWLRGIGDISTLAQTARRIGFDQTIVFKSFQITVQARSAYVQLALELPDRRGTKNGQLPQNFRLSPVAHESNCGFHIWREIRTNQSGHASILPDFALNHRGYACSTLLLNEGDRATTLFMWGLQNSCQQHLCLLSDATCASTPDLATQSDATGLTFVGTHWGLG